jgi:transposase InsO family protein
MARIMCRTGTCGCSKQRFRRTATVRSKMPAAPNLVWGHFEAGRPNELWIADVSKVRTREGWLYPAIVLDTSSRKIVGLPTVINVRHLPLLRQRRRRELLSHHKTEWLHHCDFNAR